MTTQDVLNERRQSVWFMLCKGMQQKDIAKQMGVSEGTISNDIKALQDTSEENLRNLTMKTLPFIYEKSIAGINEVLKECWDIYHNKTNSNITQWHKQAALKLAKNCNMAMFELVVNNGPRILNMKKSEERNEKVDAIFGDPLSSMMGK